VQARRRRYIVTIRAGAGKRRFVETGPRSQKGGGAATVSRKPAAGWGQFEYP
jgi:hypothetical protein